MTRYRIPDRVAHVVPEDQPSPPSRVFLMHLPDGAPVVLNDSAACIWLLAADGADDVVNAVAEMVGTLAEDMVTDVTSFLDELVAQGLLMIDPSPAQPPIFLSGL